MVAGRSRVLRLSSRASSFCDTDEARLANAGRHFVGEQSRDAGSRFLAADQPAVEAWDTVQVAGELNTRTAVDPLAEVGDSLEATLVEDRNRFGPAEQRVLLEVAG